MDDNPGVSVFGARLVVSIAALGDVARLIGRTAEAKDNYEQAITIQEPIAEKDPTNGWNRLAVAGLARGAGWPSRPSATTPPRQPTFGGALLVRWATAGVGI